MAKQQQTTLKSEPLVTAGTSFSITLDGHTDIYRVVSVTPPGHRRIGERMVYGKYYNIVVKDEASKQYEYTLEGPIRIHLVERDLEKVLP